MRYRKQILLLLMIALITIELCGCMSIERNYKEPILNYLQEKYDSNFNIQRIFSEFNGFDGCYIRAICKSDTNEKVFAVYCYPGNKKTGDPIAIGGKEYVICDDYANAIFAYQLEEQLKEQIGNEAFLQCKVTFSNHFITDEEYNAGLKSCLDTTELYAFVRVYVVAKDEVFLETIREKVEALCLGYNAYRQYLYFAVAPNIETDIIQQHFESNMDTFDWHMNECELIDKVYFSLIKRDAGITKKTVEKE